MITLPNSNRQFLAYTAPGDVDKSRYNIFFGTAGGDAGNSGSLWYDESGLGHHLTGPDPDDIFVRTSDSNGKAVMRSSTATGGLFRFTNLSSLPVSSYTAVAVVRPDSLQNPYFLDATGHSLGLGWNNSELGAYFGSDGVAHGAGQFPVGANELALITWRLNAATGAGRVYKNGQLVYTGTYSAQPFTTPGAVGHDNTVYYMPFTGDLHALVLRSGNDSDEEVQQLQTYLANLAGIAL